MIARARPLLGTLVSIRADGDEAGLHAAFAAIERVQALMGPGEESDVSRIERHALAAPVTVDRWTFEVLRTARAVSRASRGAFDVTLGRGGATHRDIVLLDARRVRLRRRARLELGGIAKGFAVDRAVEALARHGARRGSVNAGGDLRLFGGEPQTVRVRLPASPSQCVPIATATERAFATSAAYFRDEVLDARTRAASCRDASITVSAPTCMIADALTKAVAALGPLPGLLDRFRASAYRLDRHGRLYAASHASRPR